MLPDEVELRRTFWLAAPADRRELARVRALWDYLRELVGLTPETTSKVAVEKDRRRMKANQIRRAVKRHSQVNSSNRRSGSRNNNG